MSNNNKCTILVIGGGIAGLYFSLKAAAFANIILVSKEGLEVSNSNLAQGGIAASFGLNDSVDSHVKDSLVAGAGICDEKAVRVIVENAKELILDLENYGVEFDKSNDNVFTLGREGGHTVNRIVHRQDQTGKSVIDSLAEAVQNNSSIKLFNEFMALELIVENDMCSGALIVNKRTKELYKINADFTVLACGGLAQIYKQNTNPKVATGDGIAMAYRAGVKISNMEFIQFHPTILYEEKGSSFLISEAVRGFGAELKKPDGTAFMHNYHQMGSLAPRDIISRSMISEMKKAESPCMYLDLRDINHDEFFRQFPNINKKCIEAGIDIKTQMIPVVPAAHYLCGGIETDLNGNTSLNKLIALGENACTGVHGANRLASNSLLEALAFANFSAENIKKSLDQNSKSLENIEKVDGVICPIRADFNKDDLRELMWKSVGIVRSGEELENTREILEKWESSFYGESEGLLPDSESMELLNMVQAAALITKSAVWRKESRGTHFRTDFPESDNKNFKLPSLFAPGVNLLIKAD